MINFKLAGKQIVKVGEDSMDSLLKSRRIQMRISSIPPRTSTGMARGASRLAHQTKPLAGIPLAGTTPLISEKKRMVEEGLAMGRSLEKVCQDLLKALPHEMEAFNQVMAIHDKVTTWNQAMIRRLADEG